MLGLKNFFLREELVKFSPPSLFQNHIIAPASMFNIYTYRNEQAKDSKMTKISCEGRELLLAKEYKTLACRLSTLKCI